MNAPTEPPRPAPSTVAEPRQRWRIVFRRLPVASEQVGRATLDAWQATLDASGLPLVTSEADGRGRPRFSIGAPLAASIEGRAELMEVWLTERLPAWSVREALAAVMPAGHELLSTEDVWIGAPPLPGRIAAADYLVTLETGRDAENDTIERLAAACTDLLRAEKIERFRSKGGEEKLYDLRPLLLDLRLVSPGPATLAMRTRIHPELGAGRPDDVVAALGDASDLALVAREIVRLRLVLAEDLAGPAPQRD